MATADEAAKLREFLLFSDDIAWDVCPNVHDLAWYFFDLHWPGKPSRSQLDKVRRAVRQLEEEGLLEIDDFERPPAVTLTAKGWALREREPEEEEEPAPEEEEPATLPEELWVNAVVDEQLDRYVHLFTITGMEGFHKNSGLGLALVWIGDHMNVKGSENDWAKRIVGRAAAARALSEIPEACKLLRDSANYLLGIAEAVEELAREGTE